MDSPVSTTVRFTDLHPHFSDFRADAFAGLRVKPKTLSPKYFYDRRGSQLFDRITELEEYYPTRTEIAILTAAAAEIGELAGPDPVVIEYGSGSSAKTPLLLDALSGDPVYIAIDISRAHLLASCEELAARYPAIEVHAICADYTKPIALPPGLEHRRRLAFFPGSTIGNFSPGGAERFLRSAADTVGPQGALLIGVDLRKDAKILDRAYDDAEGVTAEFNLNLLARMNRELGANFNLSAFAHRAFFNNAESRVEMHLESLAPQIVTLGEESFEFAEGETIHTESSYKYSTEGFQKLAAAAGFEGQRLWTDEDGRFSVHWLEAA